MYMKTYACMLFEPRTTFTVYMHWCVCQYLYVYLSMLYDVRAYCIMCVNNIDICMWYLYVCMCMYT